MPVPGDGVPDGESYRVLRSRMDLRRLAPLSRAVTEHVITASADFDYATDLVCGEQVLAAASRPSPPGHPWWPTPRRWPPGLRVPGRVQERGDPDRAAGPTAGISSPAAAVRLAYGDAGPGAVWLIGGSAAALDEVMARNVQPALVVGVPSGLVGAAEAKDALRASGLPALSNVSEKGGAVVAAAVFCALADAALGYPDGLAAADTAVRLHLARARQAAPAPGHPAG